jgi:hypothetical protein
MAQRLSVNINHETVAVLRREAAASETSVTEIIRRAVAVYDWAVKAHRDGQRIVVEHPDGTAQQWHLLL